MSGYSAFSFTLPYELRGGKLVLEIVGEGFEDPGVCSGPPEVCYPPEAERRINEVNVWAEDREMYVPIDDTGLTLTDSEWNTLEEAIWDAVPEDQPEPEPEYEFDYD